MCRTLESLTLAVLAGCGGKVYRCRVLRMISKGPRVPETHESLSFATWPWGLSQFHVDTRRNATKPVTKRPKLEWHSEGAPYPLARLSTCRVCIARCLCFGNLATGQLGVGCLFGIYCRCLCSISHSHLSVELNATERVVTCPRLPHNLNPPHDFRWHIGVLAMHYETGRAFSPRQF